MAKAPTNKGTSTKVTRITAGDSKASSAKPAVVKPAKQAKAKKERTESSDSGTRKNAFKRIGTYFKGAWAELRQVRWPDRKSTWTMTLALLAFTAFFVVVILFLDFLFSELFKLILGSN